MSERRALVVDIDGTLCPSKTADADYADLAPHAAMLERLRAWRAAGYRIVLHTSRNMRTYEGNLGLINKHTAPVLLAWLERWDVPYDELHFGKPWAGDDGFYVDDRAVRPDEFLAHDAEALAALVRESRRKLRDRCRDAP